MSRTKNSVLNIITNYFSMFLIIVFNFIVRTVFINYLGSEYLGINGLFSNILSMLTLADLGFGTAIMYQLYSPIEKNDTQRIILLMKLFKKIYMIIGFVIVAIGIILIPFLPFIIKDYDSLKKLNINVVVVFLLYLFRTASTYWFVAYKTALIHAHQKSYIVTSIGYFFSFLKFFLEIISLIVFQSFIIYISIELMVTVVQNFFCAHKADKMYPYLRSYTEKTLSKYEIKSIFKDCAAIFIYRANTIVINATDNIVLSVFSGIKTVGLYSNYYMFTSTFKALMTRFFTSISASLGSLCASDNKDKEIQFFKTVNLITVWIYGIITIPIAIAGDEFIQLWIGKSYVVSFWEYNGNQIFTPVALLIGIELYTSGLENLLSYFRNAKGLFQQIKYRPIFTMIINLGVSIILVPIFGIAGAIIGTIVATMFTTLIVDPIVVYNKGFKISSKAFFASNIIYFLTIIISGFFSLFICSIINFGGWLQLIIHVVICVTIPSIVMFILYSRKQEFKLIIKLIKGLFPKKARSN